MNALLELATAPAATAEPGARTELAPYALVRLAALPYPPPPAGSAGFRQALRRGVDLAAELARQAGPLTDQLYASAPGHSAEFHRRVVLPLRRDVHNGRQPRPALLAALADLPGRVPAVRDWLDTCAALAQARDDLAAAAPEALAAERTVLATTCRAEPLRRAVTLVGRDLLRGIDRVAAAGPDPDSRARKAEPNALRYALRATAKTSPLSWFTHVAWGEWTEGDTPESTGGQPAASTTANRTLLESLLHAVLARPEVRARIPHRLAPALHAADRTIRFNRDIPSAADGQVLGVREQRAEVALTPPLALVLDLARPAGPAVRPPELVAALAARLPGPAAQARAAAGRFLDQLLEAGVLVPVWPVDPQDPHPLGAVADWLDRLDRSGQAALVPLASLLREIDAATRAFGARDADSRPAALDELRDRWRTAFTTAGLSWSDAPPVTEDVAVPEPARLGRAHGRAVAAAGLPAVAVLAELFDQYLPVRRLIRDRFVERYGIGGQCRRASEFAVELDEAWRDVGLVGLDGTVRDDPPRRADALTPALRELAEARAAVTAAVRDAGDPGPDDRYIPEVVLRQAAQTLPAWVRQRPSSYSFFVQPVATGTGTLLVVNHIYAGWGRFASRFLELVAPGARPAVAAQLRAVLGTGGRVAQFRPVTGFNANLHPRVVDDEVGEDPAWATIAADQLSLRHDPRTDQVRLHAPGDPAPLDVLYLGFLVPFILPGRLAPLHVDLGSGLVDLHHLLPDRSGDAAMRPRLRYRDLVLARRSWLLSTEQVAAWRADLDRDGEVPTRAATEWLARLGLPGAVFVAPARRTQPDSAEDYLRYLTQPKPQYVDFGSALHLRCLSRLLARHDQGVRVEEALPVPGAGNPDGRVVELVAETYRKAAGHG